MPPERDDDALLWDMLDSARAVVAIASRLNLEQFVARQTERRAIEREIEIIGKAARHVSVAQRHRLSHEYAEIKHDMLWNVVTVRIPELIRHLEALLPPPPAPHADEEPHA